VMMQLCGCGNTRQETPCLQAFDVSLCVNNDDCGRVVFVGKGSCVGVVVRACKHDTFLAKHFIICIRATRNTVAVVVVDCRSCHVVIHSTLTFCTLQVIPFDQRLDAFLDHARLSPKQTDLRQGLTHKLLPRKTQDTRSPPQHNTTPELGVTHHMRKRSPRFHDAHNCSINDMKTLFVHCLTSALAALFQHRRVHHQDTFHVLEASIEREYIMLIDRFAPGHTVTQQTCMSCNAFDTVQLTTRTLAF